MGRIVDYPEITTLSAGDYLIVDNAEGGTKKVSAQSVAGTVDPTPTEGSTNAVSSGGVWTSLNDISEEFDGLRDDAYDVYPKGIASSDIVQFETGADNVPLSDLTGYVYPTMSGSGMPSRTNIRTISGPDDINIYQRNKNLIEQITYQSDPETVYLGVQNSSNLTMFFKAGDYRITVNIVGGSTVEPYWSVGSTATHSEHMHLDNDTNVSIYVYDADGISASDIASFQVEVGTEATDYVEFEGDITNVVLPTDRGTIYSGRVALTAGKVYIDTVIYERNSSTMNNTEDKPGWAYTGLQTYDVAIGTFDDVIYWPNGDVRCTNVNVGSTYSVEVANEDCSLILPRDVYNMSQSQWISAGVDIQILVKLNTPIEIDIDPVEVRSLYGFNTYYCDSGKTGVIFGMDLAKYISDKTTKIQKEEQAKLEKAFATDTANGAVATFTDGADDIPMKSVKVAIEPVQDLHGYDHPWPGGGGKNLIPFPYFDGNSKTINGITFVVNDDGSLTINGTATANAEFNLVPPNGTSLPIGTYTLSGAQGSSSSVVFNWYGMNANNDTLFDYRVPTFRIVTIEEPVARMVLSVRVVSGYTASNYKVYPQLESGSVATDYAPYSNICPISGWTQAAVVRTGKNLFDLRKFSEVYPEYCSYDESTGVLTLTSNSALFSTGVQTSIPLYVSNGGYLQYEAKNESGSNFRFRVIYEDGTISELSGGTGTETGYVKIERSLYAKKIVAIRANWSGSGVFKIRNFCLTFGTSAVEYEPYTGSTYSITLPTEAGTVYGGELDVTNGVLTVYRAMVDLGTLNWSFDGVVFYTASAPMFGANGSALVNNTIILAENKCEIYKSDVVTLSNPVNGRFFVTNSQATPILRVSDDRFSDAASFRTAMDGVMAIFMLKESITYHLTPTEIKSLLGDNNVWADAGDSTVEYRADTKLYIDKKIAEVINALS